jgi:hypothetical protein
MFTALIASTALAFGHAGPSTVVLVQPHQAVTVTKQCPAPENYWFRWRLFTHGHKVRLWMWSDRITQEIYLLRTGRVLFNGITIRNHSDQVVHWKGWC